MPVVVYSIPNCPKCRAAKALLKLQGIVFEEFDVVSDKAKAKEMVEKRRSIRQEGSRDVELQVLYINGVIVEGFKREEILKALGEKGPDS